MNLDLVLDVLLLVLLAAFVIAALDLLARILSEFLR